MDRRHLLRLAAATATTLWLPRSAWSQPKFSANPFTLGVASGSPTHDSVVLWTRLVVPGGALTEAATVRWEVARDEGFKDIVKTGQSQALPELGHSVHVEVGGLEPARWYFYRFFAGDERSPTGRTRTFPAPDAMAQNLRIAYASCQRWEHGYFSAYRHMLGEQLDAVLFLGDYIYEYPGAKDAVRPTPGGWVITLDDYRRRYELHKSEAELQAMHAACPWLVTWDDHEVQNDYAGLNVGENGPEVKDFPARRAAAYQAFYEHMPLRASVLTQAVAGLRKGAETRIYGELRFGRLASFYMLDDRQYRDVQACTKGGKPGSSGVDVAECSLLADPKRTLLGPQQEAWLDQAFARAGQGWNIIGQQTLFVPRVAPTPDKTIVWNDGWDGYPAARQRLIDSMHKRELRNAVLLGGDVHENWVGHVKADFADPKSKNLAVEFCGTSITSRSNASNDKLPERLARNPHFVFADSERKGYGVCEFTPKRMSTALRVVSDVTKKDAGIGTLASFVVEAGASKIERG
jgi:alkaline phosphatase D